MMVDQQAKYDKLMALAKWSEKNASKMQRMMPLTAFLRELPWGILRDGSEGEGEDVSDTATGLAVLFMLLHSTKQDGTVDVSTDTLSRATYAMVAACGIELNRRLGIHRFTVDGDDTLLGDSTIRIELNPALDPWIRAGVAPTLDRDDPIADQIIRTVMSTSWCDHASISGPEYGI